MVYIETIRHYQRIGPDEIVRTAALTIYNKMAIKDLAGQLSTYLTMVEELKLTTQTLIKIIISFYVALVSEE